MFRTVLGSDLSDEELMKTLRQQLLKLCLFPAEALSECMQTPAVANAGNSDATSSMPPMDADVVAAFAEQLQLSIDQPRALKLLSGLGDGDGDHTTVSVSGFLNALQQGSTGSQLQLAMGATENIEQLRGAIATAEEADKERNCELESKATCSSAQDFSL